jgi:hypothetical protein
MNLSDNRFGFVHSDEAGYGIINLISNLVNIKTFDFSYMYNNSNPFTKEICVPDMSREVKYGNELKNPVSICERLTWSQFDNSISIIVFVRFSNVEFFSS